jgi:hypothetical protein
MKCALRFQEHLTALLQAPVAAHHRQLWVGWAADAGLPYTYFGLFLEHFERHWHPKLNTIPVVF